MRIISGEYKGRVFNKKLPDGIRPTTDRNRETIFNILNNYTDFEGTNIIDLCSGSGALGIEALSRGAGFVTFVDISKNSLNYIQSALNEFKISSSKFELIKSDAIKFLTEPNYSDKSKYDIIFTDPPYNKKLVNQIFNLIVTNNLMISEGIFIAESSTEEAIMIPSEWEKLTSRITGYSKIDFFRKV